MCDPHWKIDVALLLGLILFGTGVAMKKTDALPMLRSAGWFVP